MSNKSQGLGKSNLSSVILSPTPTPIVERTTPKTMSSKVLQEDSEMADSESESLDSETSRGSSIFDQESETASVFPSGSKVKSRLIWQAAKSMGDTAELDSVREEVQRQKAELKETLREHEKLQTLIYKATKDLDSLYDKIGIQRQAMESQQAVLDEGMRSFQELQSTAETTKGELAKLLESARVEVAAIRGNTTQKDMLLDCWTTHIQSTFEKELHSMKEEFAKEIDLLKKHVGEMDGDVVTLLKTEEKLRIEGDEAVHRSSVTTLKEIQQEVLKQSTDSKALRRRIADLESKNILNQEPVSRPQGTPSPIPTPFPLHRSTGDLQSTSSFQQASKVQGVTGGCPRAPTPDKFDGTKSKAADFLEQLDMLFRIEAHTYRTELQKILCAAAYLTGDASVWWQSVKQRVLSDEPLWETYVDFVEAFKERYTSPYDQRIARRKLGLLKQGSMSVDTYITQCRLLQLQARVSVTRLWEILTVGINQKVREKIRGIYHFQEPTTEEQAFNWVQEVGVGMEDDAAFDRLIDNKSNGSGHQGQLSKKHENKGSNSIRKKSAGGGVTKRKVVKRTSERSASSQARRDYGELDEIQQAVIDKRKSDNRCLRCGQKGHLFRGCTSPKKTSDPKPSKGEGKPSERKVNLVDAKPTAVGYGRVFSSPSADGESDTQMFD